MLASRAVLFAAAIVLVGMAGAQAQPANSLFLDAGPAADAGEKMQTIIKGLSTLPGYVDARVVQTRSLADLTGILSRASAKINPAAADRADDQLVIGLLRDRTIRVVGRSGSTDLEKGRWYGDVVAISDMPADGAIGAVSFTLRDGKILGTVAIPDATYEIRPAGDDLTSIIQLDTSRAPPDHPPVEQRFKGENKQDQGPTPTADPAVTYKVRIIVAYTPGAKTVIGGADGAVSVDQWVDQRINETNHSYANSNVNAELELAKLLPLNYAETGSWAQDRDRFFRKDGIMDEIFTERDSASADVAVLLFKNSTYCGEAMSIRAREDSAFAVVDTNPGCTVKFSFTHEIGHLFGAEHDAINASDPPSYPWAHGYIKGNSWRTMMAYQQGCHPCNRLPFWSSPLVNYSGAAMGSADKEDNARVLRENSRAVSEFRQ